MHDPYERQGWVGDERPSRDAFERVENRDPYPEVGGGLYTKPWGGLWTSTLRDRENEATRPYTDWLEKCHRENYWPNGPDSDLWALTLRDDVDVYRVASRDDLARAVDRFARSDLVDEPGTRTMATLDFEAMADAGWDGLHLTARGARTTRWGRPSLLCWDVESTVWFEWPATTVERVRDARAPLVSESATH